MTTNLYETDYSRWIEKQAIALKNRDISLLDWDNLLEEVESLGKNDKRAIKSLLTRLYEHVLKVVYWDAERGQNLRKWRIEINTFRQSIQDILFVTWETALTKDWYPQSFEN